MTNQPRCDLLCLSPHPDDAEIALGGTLRLLADRGRRVWTVELTRGEMATNADVEERWRESIRAAEVLGLAGRAQLALPDGFIDGSDRDQVAAVAWLLRQLRPRWVLTAPKPRRHPDHVTTPALVRRAVFLARLRTLQPQAPQVWWWPGAPQAASQGADPTEPWVVEAVGDTCAPDDSPTAYFDVSSTWQAKLDALACHASQFQRRPDSLPTWINDERFLAGIEDQARMWGRRAGVAHAEAVRMDGAPVLTDLPAEPWA
jgi:bacillithiol biosynthesis deacetylase BshB1